MANSFLRPDATISELIVEVLCSCSICVNADVSKLVVEDHERYNTVSSYEIRTLLHRHGNLQKILHYLMNEPCKSIPQAISRILLKVERVAIRNRPCLSDLKDSCTMQRRLRPIQDLQTPQCRSLLVMSCIKTFMFSSSKPSLWSVPSRREPMHHKLSLQKISRAGINEAQISQNCRAIVRVGFCPMFDGTQNLRHGRKKSIYLFSEHIVIAVVKPRHIAATAPQRCSGLDCRQRVR